jgi:hypothetical protein
MPGTYAEHEPGVHCRACETVASRRAKRCRRFLNGAYDRIPLDQRVAYYRTVSAAFASIGFQSCAWGYSNTFRLWLDGSGWIVPPSDAIATTTTVR